MKPKTDYQKRIIDLSSKLSPISIKQKEFGESLHDKLFVRLRNSTFCLECGHTWKDDWQLATSTRDVKCPNCGDKLKICLNYKGELRNMEYLGVLTTKENFQVVRIIAVYKTMKKNQKPFFSIIEVIQHWIDSSGKTTSLMRLTNSFSMYYDAWSVHSDLEIRNLNYDSPKNGITPYKIFPERKILQIIKRNGFKGRFYGFAPHKFLSKILADSYAETLLKTGHIELLKYYLSDEKFINYWSSVKVVIRNNYEIKDVSIWKDYINLLKYFNKDCRNSKYVCPDNLSMSHDRLVSKKRSIQRKQKFQELLKELEQAQKKYSKHKKPFFGLQFTDKNLTVKVMESVHEFLEEGDELEHCLFTNEYHKKKDSLLLSAKIENKSIETVEVSLSKMKIIQARGKKNKATRHHKKIINLVNSNLYKIGDIIQNSYRTQA